MQHRRDEGQRESQQAERGAHGEQRCRTTQRAEDDGARHESQGRTPANRRKGNAHANSVIKAHRAGGGLNRPQGRRRLASLTGAFMTYDFPGCDP